MELLADLKTLRYICLIGRRSWCCSSEGALLLHTMDVVIPKLRDAKLAPVRDRLNQGLEQVFFCLYAHPNKKTKVMLFSTRFQ